MSTLLEVKDITKIYPNQPKPGLDHVSFEVMQGEFLGIMGASGSGKTTLLNLIAGSILPDAGRILMDGQDITRQKEYVRARRIGRVFQDPSKGVAAGMTIAENLSLAENKGKPYSLTAGLSRQRLQEYRRLLATLGLGLEDKLEVPIGALSGGQRQAISLLMATMTPIDFLILDEHTAALDPHTADLIMQLTDRVVCEKGLTAIMVTHNLRYAEQYGNRIVMMDRGKVILDRAGEEKQAVRTDDLLRLFNEISIECGN